MSFEESQTLIGKVRFPDGPLFVLTNDCELLVLFKLLKDKCIDQIHLDIEVLPLVVEHPKEIYVYVRISTNTHNKNWKMKLITFHLNTN